MKDLDAIIGFVHASKDMITDAVQIAKENNYNLRVEPFCLEGAITAAKRLENEGVDVIVSRRSTADVLRKNLSIPVFSIPLTFFDIYQNIWRASKKWSSILFPVYSGTIDRIDELKEMIDADILFYEYDQSGQLEEAVVWGKSRGCEGAVGGPIIKAIVKKYDMGCEEIITNRESIQSTIENAYWTAVTNKKEHAKSQRYEMMLNMSSKAMIAVDKQGFIETKNLMADTILNIPALNTEPQHLNEYIKGKHFLNCFYNEETCNFHLEKIRSKQYLIEYKPLKVNGAVIGGIVTLQDSDGVVAAESKIRRSKTRKFVAKYSLEHFIYKDNKIKQIIENIKKYALTDSTILVTGETGTGKEIITHSVHNLSKRCSGPFVSINCASIPEQILESELFGYEEGAFTGARRGGKPGLFELSHNGTIFLDEIGSMPLSLQSHLLRVLQEREVMRIGGANLIPINVRIVAATNENLRKAVFDGRFREDLFFRLNVLSVEIPPLRKRKNDFSILVEKLTEKISEQNGTKPIRFPVSIIKQISELSWPGNVRELIGFLERVIILCEGRFSRDIFDIQFAEIQNYTETKDDSTNKPKLTPSELLAKNIASSEADYLLQVLKKCNYNRGMAAQMLDMSRTTLWRKIKRLGIDA